MNEDVACYLVVKHSWKGKYKRIFSIGTRGITTYNPASYEITNQWSYEDFFSIKINPRATSEFVINMRAKNKKTDSMRFSSEFTQEILCQALQFRSHFAEPRKPPKRVNAYKQHWSDTRNSITLEVAEAGLAQIDPSQNVIALYQYRNMVELVKISDYPGGFAVIYGEESKRLHLFACQGLEELLEGINQTAIENIGVGVRIRKSPESLNWFLRNRLGTLGADKDITSLVEFTVFKQTPRSKNPVRRLFCISETCVVERDPNTYIVVTVRPLKHVVCLVRSESNPQLFVVHYITADSRSYTATQRDNILASMMDGARAAGNQDVHVRTSSMQHHAYRIVPYTVYMDEEGERQLANNIITPPTGKVEESIARFNANIPYSGLLYSVTQDGIFTENKEKLIVSCLSAIVSADEGDVTSNWEGTLHALRRLFASKAGFHAFLNVPGLREKLGKKIIEALKMKSEAVHHAAIDMLCALIQPMHSNYEIRTEQMNKSSLLHSPKFLEHLLDVMITHINHGTGALVIASMLDFLTYSLCAPYSETTTGDQFDTLLKLVAARGRVLYRLFEFPSMTIVKGTGLVMRALIEEADEEMSKKMQELALAEGALLRHIHMALFTDSKDIRMLTNRQLSRRLVALWVTNNDAAMALFKRAVPKGLLNFLESDATVPLEEDMLNVRNNLEMATNESANKDSQIQQQLAEMQKVVERQMDALLDHWKLRQKITFLQKKEEKVVKPVVLRKRRQRVKPTANWKLFFYQFTKDHSQPDLIWNHKTREELKEALEAELRALDTDKELIGNIPICWNHNQFQVEYPSLSKEVRIGDYFLRLLLEEDRTGSDNPTPIHNPYQFFNEVYHHFLLSGNSEMRSLCLQALAIVYSRHYQTIGHFPDTKYILAMLQKCNDFAERDKLLVFLSKLILDPVSQAVENVRDIVNAGGVEELVDLATLAHLHVSRAYVPTQTNVIEASDDMVRDGAKEWFYSVKEGHREGPISFQELKTLYEDQEINDKTRCWCQGQEGWKAITGICQLKWTLVATGKATMNPTDLCIVVLDMLVAMCKYCPSRDAAGCVVRPVPKVQRILSLAHCLPHVVQLLLTFEPLIVQRTATLLYLVMQDNPTISRAYLTGVFFFILLYTGSNVLPIANFLHYCHLKQAFRSEMKNDIIQSSVLSPLLPEAAIFYLENYGPDKYAQVFLGEFDNPEIIWNSEMRRSMMEKIAGHVGDFSVRLPSNIRALYQYCPIAPIQYPLLENELFCHIYYLRHLTNEAKFEDWPIKDPIVFLKSCLTAWHEEIEKKPASMSNEDAKEVLNLPKDKELNESLIRKAYFKMAQKYHPDKNPEGRDMFEKINTAYEFLCSKEGKGKSDGPDEAKIVLCLRAQSIVYSRHSDELKPYKYAGYTQLIKTIRLETQDESLFSKGAPLLAAAAELAYHTLACSPLNAEQLRREDGLEALQEALDRCVSVLSRSSKPDDLAVRVCYHISQCYATAVQFPACRDKLAEMSGVFKDVCRILYFRELVALNIVASECVGAMGAAESLQSQLYNEGVLFYLIPNLFHYDYTLDEGGVNKEADSNAQEMQNRLARASCEACSRLAGLVDGYPKNDLILTSLRALITTYVTRLLVDSPIDYILKLLNSNTRNPCLIWDNGTRAEMLDFVENQRTSTVKTSEEMGAEFEFTAYKDELIIGDIYVRIYNEQPTFIFENPKAFCLDLLEYLTKEGQYIHSLISMKSTEKLATATARLGNVSTAIQALSNIIRGNPGLEMQCIGHFKLLFAFLRVDHFPALQMAALEVVSLAATNQECVNDIAASQVTLYLFLLLKSYPKSSPLVLKTLLTLSSSGRMVKEALETGGLIYILDVFCNETEDGDARIASAELLAKLQTDKLTGPRWSRLLLQYLPPIFCEAVRDSPSASVNLFNSSSENPELIWNDDSREKVKQMLDKEAKELYTAQKDDPDYIWRPKEAHVRAYEDVVKGELVVGGVFLRLFIANPSWVLRQPRQFMSELTERCLAEMNKTPADGELVEKLGSALVGLLVNQPQMTDQLSTLGYTPQIADTLKSKNPAVVRTAVMVFHQMSTSNVCANSLISCNVLPNVQSAIKLRPDLSHQASKGLKALFSQNNTELIQQALDNQTIEFLLSLLVPGSILHEADNPQAVKAEIVQTLKEMTKNLELGDRVLEILNNSTTWKEFKDQKHDLFIANTPNMGALTAGEGVAGYLTGGSSMRNPLEVPPP